MKQIYENTWIISEGDGKGIMNMYLLEGENKAIVIDSGMGNLNLYEKVHERTDKPVFVLNTHGHLDHIGANNQFDVCHMHPADRELYEKHRQSAFRYNFVKQRFLKRGLSEDEISSEDFYQAHKKEIDISQANIVFDLCDGEIIDLGNRTVKVIHTPGHTQGCVCIFDEQNNALFCGDSICEFGVLLCFPESGEPLEYSKSLQKLKDAINSKTQLYPGHQSYPLPAELIDEYIECAKKAHKGVNKFKRAILEV